MRSLSRASRVKRSPCSPVPIVHKQERGRSPHLSYLSKSCSLWFAGRRSSSRRVCSTMAFISFWNRCTKRASKYLVLVSLVNQTTSMAITSFSHKGLIREASMLATPNSQESRLRCRGFWGHNLSRFILFSFGSDTFGPDKERQKPSF